MGRYYSTTLSGCDAEDDLVETIATAVGATKILIKKLTIITAGDISIDINSQGVYSSLFQDADNLYKLSLETGDALIGSMVVESQITSDIFIACIFDKLS